VLNPLTLAGYLGLGHQACLACSKQWTFNADKVCFPVFDQCATYADNGARLSCYKGYDLKDGACFFYDSTIQSPLTQDALLGIGIIKSALKKVLKILTLL
jgi:hypothetical protein